LKYQGNRILDEGWNKNWVRHGGRGVDGDWSDSPGQRKRKAGLAVAGLPGTIFALIEDPEGVKASGNNIPDYLEVVTACWPRFEKFVGRASRFRREAALGSGKRRCAAGLG